MYNKYHYSAKLIAPPSSLINQQIFHFKVVSASCKIPIGVLR